MQVSCPPKTMGERVAQCTWQGKPLCGRGGSTMTGLLQEGTELETMGEGQMLGPDDGKGPAKQHKPRRKGSRTRRR